MGQVCGFDWGDGEERERREMTDDENEQLPTDECYEVTTSIRAVWHKREFPLNQIGQDRAMDYGRKQSREHITANAVVWRWTRTPESGELEGDILHVFQHPAADEHIKPKLRINYSQDAPGLGGQESGITGREPGLGSKAKESQDK